MRRSSLSDLIIATVVIGGVLILGGAFGYFVFPNLYREEIVYAIGDSDAAGCKGFVGVFPVILGQNYGNTDGSYRIPCGGRSRVSNTVQLHCRCPQ